MRRISIIFFVAALGCGGLDQAGGDAADTEAATESGSGSGGGGSGSTTAPTGGFDIDTTPWSETEAPATSGVDGGGSGPPAEGEESGDEDGEEEGGEPETFVGIYSFGAAVIGESYTPEGEMFAVINGDEVCLITWTATAVPDDTCMECEFAYRLTIDSLEVLEDTGCADNGQPYYDQGTTFGVGMFEEELFIDEGSGYEWVEGFGEYVADRGAFEWELELEI